MSAPSFIFPPPVREGAVIGLVAPASPPLEPEKIPEAVARLAAQGFRLKTGKHLECRTGYLAGSDAQRADDFNTMFADPEVDLVLALRGGYGSCRILPLIDYDAVRAHPKGFLGYSDNTALHLALARKAGLVTFHGPNATEAFLPSNISYLRKVLFSRKSSDRRELFSAATASTLKRVVPGQVRGRLLGGNLTCLLRVLGTPYAPEFSGAILFLEDISEKAYRVDGMFTHLRLAGVLDQIGGLVLGRFDHGEEAEHRRIADLLQGEAESIGLPCVSGAPIGHFPEQIIVPHGAMAVLDAGQTTLTLD